MVREIFFVESPRNEHFWKGELSFDYSNLCIGKNGTELDAVIVISIGINVCICRLCRISRELLLLLLVLLKIVASVDVDAAVVVSIATIGAHIIDY